jgi:CrcB protein
VLNVVLVAFGGAIGCVARYFVNVWSVRLAGTGFPWGTLSVNLVGSFAIGLLAELIARRFNASNELRLFLITGILGGFTTFSAFSLDTISLFERGEYALTGIYIGASLGLSIVAVFAGLALGRSLF